MNKKLTCILSQQVSTYYLIRYVMRRLENADPTGENKKEREKKAKSSAILRRLDNIADAGERHGASRGDIELTSYEQSIAMEVVAPEDIHITFEGLGYPH